MEFSSYNYEESALTEFFDKVKRGTDSFGDYKFTYINGNYFVKYTKRKKTKRALRFGEELRADFPDSIDLKITNSCSIGCKFCHESSTPGGKSFDVKKTIALLDKLPKCGIEVAIGGGDVLDCLGDVKVLVNWLYKNKFQPRLTINFESLRKYFGDKPVGSLQPLFQNCYGSVGISVNSIPEKSILLNEVCQLEKPVFHIIAGIFPIDDVIKLYELVNSESGMYNYTTRILVLGYKQFGRASGTSINLDSWKEGIKKIIYDVRVGKIGSQFGSNLVIGFDNLALEQLDIESSLLPSEWDELYNGDDFSSSMYIDAVEEKFAPTSRSPYNERVSWDSVDLIEYFKNNHK